MTPNEFIYWLHGYFEIENPKSIDERKTQIIKDHLALLFNKVTPDRNKELILENTYCAVNAPGSNKIC